ncbi:unnamed protein product [Effrenium voratum]|uniref:EamA domain-containing protein n=1 Tax=Effrenium voratum TaxID=2562239 RepID=A0AA36NB09_9DINO|nr:unnamed protein product [Effrenium voratum]CAJ1400597.1 unnamed protein product [Effrenium voratum]CAJ1426844.1 unnamed protein product [Effrenium voratum]
MPQCPTKFGTCQPPGIPFGTRFGMVFATPQVFGLLIFNGLFDNVLSQFAWAKAVQWTSPTTATVGLSLTIPLSVVADILRHQLLSLWTFVAAVLVVIGFVAVTLASKPASQAVMQEPVLEAECPSSRREPVA